MYHGLKVNDFEWIHDCSFPPRNGARKIFSMVQLFRQLEKKHLYYFEQLELHLGSFEQYS
ncbi:hypothetical protein EMIT0P253_10507 [Pseudomonas sp. IT-P253]